MTDPWAATLLSLPVPLDLLALALALAFDLLFGEPPVRIHPTVLIGRTISAAERHAPAVDAAPGAQVAYGAVMAATIPAAWGALAWAVSAGLRELHPLLYLAAAAVLLKPTFSVRMLAREAGRIGELLAAGDLAAARRRMPALVSRETGGMTASQAAAGAIESVAENSTDSVVGPLLAFALFGLPGAVVYRAVNTLDSMIGYRGRYEYLGKAAARLDDLVNLIPARLTAMLLWCAAALLPALRAARSWRIMWAHRRRTASPNAGWTIAAMAGALGVSLEKPGYYRIGDPAPQPDSRHIRQATRALYCATLLAAALAGGVITILAGWRE